MTAATIACHSLPREDTQQLLRDYQRLGRPVQIRDRIVQGCGGLVMSIANKFATAMNSLGTVDDLYQEGVVGLMKAIDTYRFDRGVPFPAYAAILIRGRIQDALRKADWQSRHARHHHGTLTNAVDVFVAEQGRKPTAEELRHRLRMSPKTWKLRARHLDVPQQLCFTDVETACREHESNGHLPVLQIFDTRERVGEPEIRDLSERAMQILHGRERLIFFYHHIANKPLVWISGLIRMMACQVSQIHTRALRRVRDAVVHHQRISRRDRIRYCKRFRRSQLGE